MILRLFLLFNFVMLWALPAAARDYCSEKWACVGSVKQANGDIYFWLENKKEWPVTITLLVDTDNFKTADNQVQKNWAVTRVLPGRQKQTVLNLTKINPRQAGYFKYDIKWIPGDMYARHEDDYRYSLPFASERDYRVVQGFNGGYSHQGASKYALDFAMPVGTPVHAARDGVVIDLKSHHWKGGASRRYAKYANFVVILHDDGTTGEYYHLKQHGVVVAPGDKVEVGQLIGYSGNTGFSSLPHLHFAVYRARSHGGYESLPVQFQREPNTWRRRGLGRK